MGMLWMCLLTDCNVATVIAHFKAHLLQFSVISGWTELAAHIYATLKAHT
jgi:hypothetical protein